MMENHSLAGGKQANKPSDVPRDILNLVGTLTPGQLMALRHHLDMELEIEINQLNLTEELGLQYRQGKILLASIQDATDVPANQKAQVFNSVQAQLEKIVKLRAQVFSQERLKRYEKALLQVLELQGNDTAKNVFLDLYGEYLNDRGV